MDYSELAKKMIRQNPTATVPTTVSSKPTLSIAQPNKTYSNPQTAAQWEATIWNSTQNDLLTRNNLYAQLDKAYNTPGSGLYMPYRKATNQPIIDTLSSLGIDVSGGINDDFFSRNSVYNKYLVETQSTLTGTPNAPKSSTSKEGTVAYWLYQLQKDEELTKKAEQEWTDLQSEVTWYAKHGYTNEEISKKIDMSKYSTLKSMDDNAALGTPTRLNRSIGYSQDAINGVIWNARNGRSEDPFQAAVYAAMGSGIQDNTNWKAKRQRTPGTSDYNPYVAGATDESLKMSLGVDSWDDAYLLAHSLEMTQSQFNSAKTAWENTRKAKSELTVLQKAIDHVGDPDALSEETLESIKKLGVKAWAEKRVDLLLDNAYNAEDDTEGLPTLKKMDEGRAYGRPLSLSDSVDYRKEDAVQRVIDTLLRAHPELDESKRLPEAAAEAEQTVKTTTPKDDELLSLQTGDTAAPARTPAVPTDEEEELLWIQANGVPAAQTTPREDENTELQANPRVPTTDKEDENSYIAGNPKKTETLGRYGKGNIDLYNTIPVTNEDGTTDSLDPFRIYMVDEGKDVVLPRIVNGKRITEEEAIDEYKRFGTALGVFTSQEDAEAYIKQLNAQQKMIHPDTQKTTSKDDELLSLQTGDTTSPAVPSARDTELLTVASTGSVRQDKYGEGNIDLDHLQPVINEDGTVDVLDPFRIYMVDEGMDVVLPRVYDGERISEGEAIDNYKRYGIALGKFDNAKDADEYIEQLNARMAEEYPADKVKLEAEVKEHKENAQGNKTFTPYAIPVGEDTYKSPDTGLVYTLDDISDMLDNSLSGQSRLDSEDSDIMNNFAKSVPWLSKMLYTTGMSDRPMFDITLYQTLIGDQATQLIQDLDSSYATRRDIRDTYLTLFKDAQDASNAGYDSLAKYYSANPDQLSSLQEISQRISDTEEARKAQEAADLEAKKANAIATTQEVLARIANGYEGDTEQIAQDQQFISQFIPTRDEEAYSAIEGLSVDGASISDTIDDMVEEAVNAYAYNQGLDEGYTPRDGALSAFDAQAVGAEVAAAYAFDVNIAKQAGMTLEELYEKYPDMKRDFEATWQSAIDSRGKTAELENLSTEEKAGIGTMAVIGLGVSTGWRSVLSGNVGFWADVNELMSGGDDTYAKIRNNYQSYQQVYGTTGDLRWHYRTDLMSRAKELADMGDAAGAQSILDQITEVDATGQDIFQIPIVWTVEEIERNRDQIVQQTNDALNEVADTATSDELNWINWISSATGSSIMMGESLLLDAVGSLVGLPAVGSAVAFGPGAFDEAFRSSEGTLKTETGRAIFAGVMAAIDVITENDKIAGLYNGEANALSAWMQDNLLKEYKASGVKGVATFISNMAVRVASNYVEEVSQEFKQNIMENVATGLAYGLSKGNLNDFWEDSFGSVPETVEEIRDTAMSTLLSTAFSTLLQGSASEMYKSRNSTMRSTRILKNKFYDILSRTEAENDPEFRHNTGSELTSEEMAAGFSAKSESEASQTVNEPEASQTVNEPAAITDEQKEAAWGRILTLNDSENPDREAVNSEIRTIADKFGLDLNELAERARNAQQEDENILNEVQKPLVGTQGKSAETRVNTLKEGFYGTLKSTLDEYGFGMNVVNEMTDTELTQLIDLIDSLNATDDDEESGYYEYRMRSFYSEMRRKYGFYESLKPAFREYGFNMDVAEEMTDTELSQLMGIIDSLYATNDEEQAGYYEQQLRSFYSEMQQKYGFEAVQAAPEGEQVAPVEQAAPEGEQVAPVEQAAPEEQTFSGGQTVSEGQAAPEETQEQAAPKTRNLAGEYKADMQALQDLRDSLGVAINNFMKSPGKITAKKLGVYANRVVQTLQAMGRTVQADNLKQLASEIYSKLSINEDASAEIKAFTDSVIGLRDALDATIDNKRSQGLFGFIYSNNDTLSSLVKSLANKLTAARVAAGLLNDEATIDIRADIQERIDANNAEESNRGLPEAQQNLARQKQEQANRISSLQSLDPTSKEAQQLSKDIARARTEITKAERELAALTKEIEKAKQQRAKEITKLRKELADHVKALFKGVKAEAQREAEGMVNAEAEGVNGALNSMEDPVVPPVVPEQKGPVTTPRGNEVISQADLEARRAEQRAHDSEVAVHTEHGDVTQGMLRYWAERADPVNAEYNSVDQAAFDQAKQKLKDRISGIIASAKQAKKNGDPGFNPKLLMSWQARDAMFALIDNWNTGKAELLTLAANMSDEKLMEAISHAYSTQKKANPDGSDPGWLETMAMTESDKTGDYEDYMTQERYNVPVESALEALENNMSSYIDITDTSRNRRRTKEDLARNTRANNRNRNNNARNVPRSPSSILERLTNQIGVGLYTQRQDDMLNSIGALAGYHRNISAIYASSKTINSSIILFHEFGHAMQDHFGMTTTQNMIDVIRAVDPTFIGAYPATAVPGEAFAEFTWRYLNGEEAVYDQATVNQFEEELRAHGVYDAIRQAREELIDYHTASVETQVNALITNYEHPDTATSLWGGIKRALAHFINAQIDAGYETIRFDRTVNLDAPRDYQYKLPDGTVIPVRMTKREYAKKTGILSNDLNLRQYYRMTKDFAAGKVVQQIEDGLTDMWGRRIAPGLRQVLDVKSEEELNELRTYLLLKHSLSREAQDKTVFGYSFDTTGNSHDHNTTSNITKEILEMDRRNPELATKAEAFSEWWASFMDTWMVNTGLVTKEQAEDWQKKYPYYVPTMRDLRSVKEPSPGTSISNPMHGTGFELAMAKGDSHDILDPFQGLMQVISTTVLTAYQNNMLRYIYNTIDIAANNIGQFAIKTDEANEGPDTMVAMINGEKKYLQFANGELMRAIDSSIHSTSVMKVLNTIGNLTSAMTMLTTGENPLFTSSNIFRDFQHSVNQGTWATNYVADVRNGMLVPNVITWLRAAYEVATESEDYQRFEAIRGNDDKAPVHIASNRRQAIQNLQRIYEDYGKNRVQKGLNGLKETGVGKVLEVIHDLPDVAETTSRYVEYKFGKHDLSTEEGRVRAVLAAQEVTTDFDLAGYSKFAKFMKKLIPFYNATLQGTWQMIRTFLPEENAGATNADGSTKNFSDRQIAAMSKTAINNLIFGALTAFVRNMFSDDDDKEWYDRLSEDIKYSYAVLPFFDQKEHVRSFIRLPLDQNPLSKAFYAAGDQIISVMNGDGFSYDLGKFCMAMLGETFQADSIAAPIVSLYTNRNWYNGTIVNESLLELPKTGQYYDTTPEVFKWMSRMQAYLFGEDNTIAPLQLQNMAQQWGGVIGQILIPTLSPDRYTLQTPENVGEFIVRLGNKFGEAFVNRWTIEPGFSNDIAEDYYSKRKELDSILTEVKNTGSSTYLSTKDESKNKEAVEALSTLYGSYGPLTRINDEIKALRAEEEQVLSNPSLDVKTRGLLRKQYQRDIILKEAEGLQYMNAFYEDYGIGEKNMTAYIITGGGRAEAASPCSQYGGGYLTDHASSWYSACLSVYNESPEHTKTGKADTNVMPHPDMNYSWTSLDGTKQTMSIKFSKYYDGYINEHYTAYKQYVNDNVIPMWDVMDYEAKKNALTKANTYANKMAKQYLRERLEDE